MALLITYPKKMNKRAYLYRASHGFGGKPGVLIVSQIDREDSTLGEWIFTQPPPWGLIRKSQGWNTPTANGLVRRGLDGGLAISPDLFNRELISSVSGAIVSWVIASRNQILTEYLRIKGAPTFNMETDFDAALFHYVFSSDDTEVDALSDFFGNSLDTDLYAKIGVYKAVRQQMNPHREQIV